MASPPKVLISGSGIAGSAFAFCLLRAYKDADITIIERDPAPRLTGASIDIRNSGVEIIKWMGLEPIIRDSTTKEEGVAFVGNDGKPFATFKATGRTDIQSVTSEYEIFRGALAKIFMDPIKDQVKMLFNETVQHFEEHEKGVTVTFSSGKRPPERFDLLVAADGLGSRIRGTILKSKPREQIKDEGVHTAYFTVEKDLLEGSRIAKWHNMPGGRAIFLRPDPHPAGRTRAHFMNATWKSQTEFRERLNTALESHDAYKSLLEEQFRGGSWISNEILDAMYTSPDFYCSLFAQVRSPTLHSPGNRVVLLGDAGYATPGIGTSLAIIGSYILAGELLTHPNDYSLVCTNYEKYMLDLVKKEQGDDVFMQLMNPQSRWGISVRNSIVWFIATTRIDYAVMILGSWLGWTNSAQKLPEYAWPKE